MKKTLIFAAVATAGMIAAPSAQAALAADATLLMGPQAGHCQLDLGTYPDACLVAAIPDANYFAMDNDGSGVHEETERVAMSAGTDGGITLGSAQGAGAIDVAWNFFGAFGNHTQTTIGISGGDDGTGDGIASLDMTSLVVDWNGNLIPMGGSALFPEDTGIASVLCGVDCAAGDSFVLDYTAHVPLGFGFDNVFYALHLEGTIGGGAPAVPVPAAVWLFGSGLLGLVGVARRRKVA